MENSAKRSTFPGKAIAFQQLARDYHEDYKAWRNMGQFGVAVFCQLKSAKLSRLAREAMNIWEKDQNNG